MNINNFLLNPWIVGIGVTVIGGLILYYFFGIGKNKSSKLRNKNPNVTFKGIKSFGNGGDGIHIEGNQNVKMENVETYANRGEGINIKKK